MSGADFYSRLATEVHRQIVGQEQLMNRLAVALLADGHVLLEGVPGLAKTKVLTALTAAVDGNMNRVQFTPDLLPSDLIGTEVYRPQSGEFVLRKGPIFTNMVLADEINRAPAKVQSALLQAMQEREVSIGESTFRLPEPFMVLATQNPIEQEGTYPLPEAQLDRFLMKLTVTYPSFDDEVSILQLPVMQPQGPGTTNSDQRTPVVTLDELRALRKEVPNVFVDPRIDRYIVTIVHATRDAKNFGLRGMVEWGASPRGSIALKNSARALAFLRGENSVTPEIVQELVPDVLRHRILTSFEAEAKGINADEVLRVLIKSVQVP